MTTEPKLTLITKNYFEEITNKYNRIDVVKLHSRDNEEREKAQINLSELLVYLTNTCTKTYPNDDNALLMTFITAISALFQSKE